MLILAIIAKAVIPWTALAIGGSALIGGISSLFSSSSNRSAQAEANETNLAMNAANNETAIRNTNATNEANLQMSREYNDMVLRNQQMQNEWNLAQWNRENSYNSPAAQYQRLVSAGINPNLAMIGQGSIPAGSLESADAHLQQAPPAQVAPTTAGHVEALPAINYGDAFNSAYTNLMQGLNLNSSLGVQAAQRDLVAEQAVAQQLENDVTRSTMLDRLLQMQQKTKEGSLANQMLQLQIDDLMEDLRVKKFTRGDRVKSVSLGNKATEKVIERADNDMSNADAATRVAEYKAFTERLVGSAQADLLKEQSLMQKLESDDWFNELDRVTKRFKMEKEEHAKRMDLLDLEKQFRMLTNLGVSKENAYNIIMHSLDVQRATERNESWIGKMLRKKFGIDLQDIGIGISGTKRL